MATLNLEPSIRPDDGTTLVQSKEEDPTEVGREAPDDVMENLLRIHRLVERMELRTESKTPMVKTAELAERGNTSTSPPTVVERLSVPKAPGFLPFEKGVVICGIALGVIGAAIGLVIGVPIVTIFSLGIATLLTIHGLAVLAGE